MVVSKKDLMKQMAKEIEAALHTEYEEEINQRIASVRTLCEVILSKGTDKTNEKNRKEFTEQEIKAMLGKEKQTMSEQELKTMLGEEGKNKYTADPERGDSIFDFRSEEHTSELQSRGHLVCRLLLEKKKRNTASMLKSVDVVAILKYKNGMSKNNKLGKYNNLAPTLIVVILNGERRQESRTISNGLK